MSASAVLRLVTGLLLAPLAAIFTSSAWSLHGPGEPAERLIWSGVLFALFWTGFAFLAWWPQRAWPALALSLACIAATGAVVATS